MPVIDSHIHCGVQNVHQPYRHIQPLLQEAGIEAACLFAPVEDIYDRNDPDFDDNAAWRTCRRNAHAYLLQLARQNPGIFPYYFVWNDFAIEDLDLPFRGIKWHHHAGEPAYRYEDPRCTEMIDAICSRQLPIVLEETFERTLQFIRQVAGRTVVIIPHLGLLNGGFERLRQAGVWEDDTVYADTALAGRDDIGTFVEDYGAERLLFGSDYPFGRPADQLAGVRNLGLGENALEKICGGNISRLLKVIR
jgi:predicted TIM-barrel fold metal-dependent hydrolase